MADDWSLIKKRRNSDWSSVIQEDMSEADARTMAANMNKFEPDLRYYYVAKAYVPENEFDTGEPGPARPMTGLK